MAAYHTEDEYDPADIEEYGAGTLIDSDYEDDYFIIKAILAKYCFDFFTVSLKYGYYESFSIDIKLDVFAFDYWKDRRDAQKEVTAIKAFLLECAEHGLVACFPSWCTKYCDYDGTIKEISAAVKAMRADVKNTPTFLQAERKRR